MGTLGRLLPPFLGAVLAAQDKPPDLSGLSLEELGELVVTSVSRGPERLARAPASVYVITAEEIRRSGALTLPEALRLAPNLQVARVDASQYAIGAGGLNISNVNKLLVLVDGRTIYSPVHAGVFWDSVAVSLEEVERIEVIRGPGGALWGSNAVNGILNIITRPAGRHPGGRMGAGLGSNLAQGRYEQGPWRIHASHVSQGPSTRADGSEAGDTWQRALAGFRLDRGGLTLQGDASRTQVDQPGLESKRLQGAHLLARWGWKRPDGSRLDVQAYLDRVERRQPSRLGTLDYVYDDRAETADLEVQHGFRAGSRHDLLWGGGARLMRHRVVNNPAFSFLPARKDLRLFQVFLQDTLSAREGRLKFTAGARMEHNGYTGWEFQPSLRLAWTPAADHLLWAAASRAVRTPSRVDRDFYVDLPGVLELEGGPRFRSEVLVAWEAGYRGRPAPWLALSASTFYNQYRHLRTLEVRERVLANHAQAESYGAEVWGEFQAGAAWRLKPSYVFQRLSFRTEPGSSDTQGVAGAGNDARHRVQVASLWRPAEGWEVDAFLRHMSALPNPEVPAYWAVDARVGWRPFPGLEVSVLAKDLGSPRHAEFGPKATRRFFEPRLSLRLAWTF